MAIKNSKNKNQNKYTSTPQQRIAQIIFAVFAIIVIASMVLTAIVSY